MTIFSLRRTKRTDEQLMTAAARGSDDAFAELYNRYARRLQGFFMRQLRGDREAAADCTHDVFLRAYAARTSWRDGRKVDVWLFTIAYNICRNIWRHGIHEAAYMETQSDPPVTDSEAEAELDAELFRQALRTTLATLRPDDRMMFSLHYEEELTVPEIAQIYTMPEGTVKSRLHRIMTNIKQKMTQYENK